jgi:spore germination cell wall hydrolase CwlJ-like protein
MKKESDMRIMMQIIVAILALTVMAPGQAQSVDKHDLDCLARNIYYEAGLESEEGKVAVGLVTINRSNDEKFPQTICGVVNQKTVFSVPKTIIRVKEITTGVVFKTVQRVKETQVVWTSRVVCQFSWRCEHVRKINYNDSRWENSLAVAQELLEGGYTELRDKYQNVEYFHEKHIRPAWAHQKRKIERIGGHIFYADKSQDLTIAKNLSYNVK